MSEKYIPLYRKYRPKNLQEVVGQDHIKKALANAISLNKISHAYLFTGPRGTGKTSIARILAKSLNCKEGPTLTPCEVCPSCMDIKNSTLIDVIEIDAASNRKVEDAQNILEKIQYVPVNGKYKIYIIDEVHMLTNHAFNALLKTLEEPPENVIFILATTEPQKVLETITSRCQRFDFKRITTDEIINHIKNIAKSEKIKINDDALFTIAKNSAGGMRDSLALLDQVSVLDNSKTITSDDVNRLLGRLSFDMLHNLSENIVQSKPQEAIELLEQIYNSGNEPTQILINMLGYFKNLLIAKNCQKSELLANLTQLNNSQIQSLKTQSENIETHQITFLIGKIVYYIKELKASTNQYLWLEVAIIDLANLTENTSLLALQERISHLEANGVNIAVNSQSIQPIYKSEEKTERGQEDKKRITQEKDNNEHKTINTEQIAEKENLSTSHLLTSSPQETQLTAHSSPSSQQDVAKSWLELLQTISSPPTVSLLSEHARPIEFSDNKIIIGCEKDFALKMLSADAKKKVIEDAAKKLLGNNISVIIKLASATDFSVTEKKNVIEEGKKTGRQEGKQSNEPVVIQSDSLDEIEDDEIDFIEHELAKKKSPEFIPSDQVSMIMTLFDGKYIE